MSLYKWVKHEEKNAESNVRKAEKVIEFDKKEAKDRMWKAIGIAFMAGIVCWLGSGAWVGFVVLIFGLVIAWAVVTTKNEYIEKMLINDLRHEKQKLAIIQNVLEELESE